MAGSSKINDRTDVFVHGRQETLFSTFLKRFQREQNSALLSRFLKSRSSCITKCAVSSIPLEVGTHGIDSRVGVDLQCVNVITGVLEQAVVWVQHLM